LIIKREITHPLVKESDGNASKHENKEAFLEIKGNYK
jgi:hypothetical protein